MQVWNVLHAARWKCRTQKNAKKLPPVHHHTTFSGYIFAIKARIDNRKKNLLSSNISSRCPHNMVNFGLLAAEIDPVVWGTPVDFNGFHVLVALLHGSQVVSISQTLRHWTEGATYVRQGDHQVGHWPTFWLFISYLHPLTFDLLSVQSAQPAPNYRWCNDMLIHSSISRKCRSHKQKRASIQAHKENICILIFLL